MQVTSQVYRASRCGEARNLESIVKSSVFDRQKTEDSRTAELKKLADALQRPVHPDVLPQKADEKPAQ